VAGWLTGVDPEAISPLRAVADSVTPTLLIHSRADETVPFRHAELLWSATASNPHAQSLFFDDLPHGAASEEFAATVDAFFEANLETRLP
jgi:fermentation-respiration switch protein FrsA (DUF1100 family)